MEWITANWHTAVLAVLGIYEVLARLIPTVENWSILHKIITFLKLVSDTLNVKK